MSDAEKPELRRANDNPWYCLATLHGEQPAQEDWDKDLAAKNRMAWNRWMAGVLSDEQRADLVKKGFSEAELVPLTPAEESAFCSAFASRMGGEKELPPNPTEFVDFTFTHFDCVVIFRGFLYVGNADFSSAKFSLYADFRSAKFSGEAHFLSAQFFGNASFGSAKFSLANFSLAKFSGNAHFRSAEFSVANFNSATFSVANFISAKFSVADFFSAKFCGNANFGSTMFSVANFNSATFAVADFDSAKFFGNAKFSSATFTEANFSSGKFSEADFNSAKFSVANFSSAKFSGDAKFINAEFTANTVFADARFETAVPDFRGAKMHEATEWHGVSWPSAPRDKDTAQAQVYAYERLKQEMERLKKYEDEQFFFRKELRARRGLISPQFFFRKELRARRRLVSPGFGAWLLNYFYEASSDYGQSIGRPLLWLFVVFVIGSAIFAGTPVSNGTRMTIPGAAGLSFANIFSFLPLTHEFMIAEMTVGLSSAAKIVSVVQSVLGALLLFLLGLALRTRFRMR